MQGPPWTPKKVQAAIAEIEARFPIPPDYETRAGKQTVVELWPEKNEDRETFLARRETALSKCIGPSKASKVCATKWRKSERLGKKSAGEMFMARGLDETETTEACGGSCLGCAGADAPFGS